MKYDINAFYDNMRNAIEKRGLSYKEIYTELGMQQSNFSNAYHRKKHKQFTLDQMLRITEILGCSLDEMFTRETDGYGAQYIKIPDMSKWTCSDLLKLLFSLRKSGGEVKFLDAKVLDSFSYEIDVTGLYFSKRFGLKNNYFGGSNTSDMLINTVLREWAQIIRSTENVDSESREFMLSKWEENKIEQHKNIMLSDEPIEYDIDSRTKQYFRIEK